MMEPSQVGLAITKLRQTIQVRNDQNKASKLLIEKLLIACPAAKDIVAPSKKDGSADCRWAHRSGVSC